jgi:hypothetical protein
MNPNCHTLSHLLYLKSSWCKLRLVPFHIQIISILFVVWTKNCYLASVQSFNLLFLLRLSLVAFLWDAPTIIINYSGINFNPLKTKRRLLYLKTQFLPRCKHFSTRLWNQLVYDVSGTRCCLLSDKCKTHKYSVGRAYDWWILNVLLHHVNSRL